MIIVKVLVLGSDGQLGSDVVRCSPRDFDIIRHTRKDWDVTDDGSDYIVNISPDVIINCSGYVRVDDCEDYPEIAMAVNSDSTKRIAKLAKQVGAVLMHVSTDYVFGKDEGRIEPYAEDDIPEPINIYGVSKLAGEHATISSLDRYYIVRISSVFGISESKGRKGNFVYSIMERGVSGEPVTVIDDIIMSPTYTVDAAQLMWSIITDEMEFGIYHCNNEGQCSWFDFTKEIFHQCGIDSPIIPVSRSEFGSIAKRPKFSAMTTKREIAKRRWKEGLQGFLRELS